jgi:hypothetical protein
MPHKKVEFNGGKILMGSDQILEMGANAGFAESFAKGFRAAQDKELLDSIFEDSVISKIADETGEPYGGLDNTGQMLPPPPNHKAVGKPPIPQIGDIKQSVDGKTMDPWDAASPAYQKPIPPPKKPSPEPMDLTSKRRIALNE